MAEFAPRANVFVIPVALSRGNRHPAGISLNANQVDHHAMTAYLGCLDRQFGNGAQMHLKLADAGAGLGPVAAVVHAGRELVDDQFIANPEALHRHHADVVHGVHNFTQHGLCLALQVIHARQRRYGRHQNTVAMQVECQWIKHVLAIAVAGADQRQLFHEWNFLLGDGGALPRRGHVVGIVTVQPVLALAVVAARATLQ